MALEIFGSSKSDIQDSRLISLEEAKKRGLTTRGGFLSLLGELDYFSLIEKMVRSPITDKQLITPYRFWIFFKGLAFANAILFSLFVLRIGLLLTGPDVNYVVKYVTYLFTKAFTIYFSADLLINYVRYPKGITFSAVKYSLFGYLAGIVFFETIFEIILFLSLIFRSFVESRIYERYHFVIDRILELYYGYFCGSIFEEFLSLFIVYYAAALSLWRFFRLKKVLETAPKKPYQIEDV